MLVWAKRCFIAYLLTSPYYIFPSGGLQISTFFLGLMILLTLAHIVANPRVKPSFREILRNNRYLIVFVSLATIINVIYFLIYSNQRFLSSSLYLILNVLVVGTLIRVRADKRFLKGITLAFKFNVLAQLIIYLVGLGRYHPTDTYRLMGTFNDPNQLAFYVFLAMLFIYAINQLQRKSSSKTDWLFWAVGVFLIILSSSTGVFLGLATFVALLVLLYTKEILSKMKRTLVVSLVIAGMFLLGGAMAVTLHLHNIGVEIPIIGRIVDKANEEDGRNLLEDRGLDTVVHYPKHLLFGAGEGSYSRFPEQRNGGLEIHSSLIALAFYYGIIPVTFLVKWLYDVTKKIDIRIKIAFIAILIESFTLINYRQPLLWALLILPTIAPRVQSKPAKRS